MEFEVVLVVLDVPSLADPDSVIDVVDDVGDAALPEDELEASASPSGSRDAVIAAPVPSGAFVSALGLAAARTASIAAAELAYALNE